ncbi:hypothetical protein KCTC32516_02312 [Polaribacter huanghezhanensis]|uniref:hypothetical protein n=1 Tax=Polaribacter huanghezhanensis TaxID=1354726 RepID=UPI002647DC97|nr:hypothetical protein [Polaribacter huanghezhanensis]WKD86932.1 hypothetical protein KCTC32516_02312 [Polaribacter huanghezhanensis]
MKYKLLSTVFIFSFLFQTITAQDHKMFTNSRLILGTYKERTASVSSGDIDGDGFINIIEANSDQINRYYINQIKK